MTGSHAKRRLRARIGDAIARLRGHIVKRIGGGQPSAPRYYRVPADLRGAGGRLGRPLLIGSCLVDPWVDILAAAFPGTTAEVININNASSLPEMSEADQRGFDYQVIQIPLRAMLSEASYFSLKANDVAGHEALYTAARDYMRFFLDRLLAYHKATGLPAYVLNFPVPQQNPLGRAQPRYCLSNMVYFVERLNRDLDEACRAYANVTVVDLDQIVATFGRRYFQDDAVFPVNHSSSLTDIRHGDDHARLEPIGRIDDSAVEPYIVAVFEEIAALRRSALQTDAVKLVIFDLDDTLWRGIGAEAEDISTDLYEGWPLGMLEAAAYLWKRGILLAIVSKNDEAVVRDIWDVAYGTRFPLDRFVSVRINWDSKAANIRQILQEVNLLPESVLFVDDNPVERAAVRNAIPGIRTLEASLDTWRRILLWAPELQRAGLTEEAVNRTEMVQARMARETARDPSATAGDHQQFLRELGTTIQVFEISATNPRIERCLELLNKTNQFNTTGRRWTSRELHDFVHAGGSVIALQVSDRLSAYGIVAVMLLDGACVRQLVLSCRVFGMQIEHAAIAIAQGIAQEVTGARARLSGVIVPTERNRLAVDIFRDLGFEARDGLWFAPEARLTIPGHITVT